MRRELLQDIFEQQFNDCQEILFKKAKEYSKDDEQLHNFNIAGVLTGVDPVRALGGMMVKHTISIYDMINEGAPATFSMDQWDEKITDHINYLILLKAAVFEDMWGSDDEEQPPLPLEEFFSNGSEKKKG